ncbi:down syndrome cell adhesion molecule-like protein 1 homolog [Nephila pilipes]|uniref:Down syndrome cell adhesion molecule-like protein 1 homolog n=1 Tax=Nephila pilipes TaxID=299642 RepID=A0A8X6QFY6_NEPPI|nr:down syndrome cell adhesion molecule-like protein 1 homolog [Nephila pilipes]
MQIQITNLFALHLTPISSLFPVLQDYKVTAYDAEFIIKGNVALLRCDISGNGKEYVFVTSWLRDDGLTISLNDNNGKYAVFPTGEFHVRHVDEADTLRKYRCQVHNKLSRETKLSDQWAKIIMTEPHGSVPPRIVHWRRDIQEQNGETIWLPCVAHGYPVPTVRWFRQDSSLMTTFANNHRVIEQEGMLVIHRATLQDSGKYVCVVNNTKGQEQVHTVLTVRDSLRTSISPSHTVVTVGTSLSLRCEVSGSPILYLKWKKNLKPLVLDNRIRQQSNNVLEIANVRLGDEGMYQCFIYNSEESAQGSATVLIQADPPVIISRFEEQIVNPGHPVSLRCIAKGHPLPKITWTADGESIPSSSRLRLGDFVTQDGSVVHSFLNISSVEVGDGKEYSCNAESDFGRAFHQARLNVPSSPVGRPFQNKTALVGQTAIFVCPVAGYPLSHFAWEKDGESLPNSHRHEVRPNGKIVIHYVEKNTDDGIYWCTAGNNRGVSARGRIDVHVVAGPVLDPFNFPENLREGRRTTLTCMVSAGDPPISFRWEKDGEPIQPNVLDATVEYINQYTSTLFFEKASQKHNGNYTCIASNPYASANHTASLTLNIPPRWIIEPKDVEVVQGSSVRVDCQAEGYPRPIIRWKQLVGVHGNPESFQTIMSSARMQVLENGSLLILEASPSDGGSFLCQAFNRIGPGLSKMLTITVHVPAHFKTKFNAQKAKKGDQVNLNCKAQGDKPITITWYKDGEILGNGTIPRYSKRQYDHHDGLTSQLNIHSVRREDSSVFSCRATNRYGHDDSTVELVVQEAPDHPTQLEVIHISSRSIHIRWAMPFNGNSPILRFLVVTENTKGNSDSNIVTTDISGSQTDTTLRGLKPRTLYNIHVLAENAIGRSTRSKILTVTTDDEVPRTPPLQVRVIPTSSNSLRVSWMPPEEASDGGGSITGYYVGYKAAKNGGQYLFKTLKVTDGFENECLLTNLLSSTEYNIVVQAFNDKGPGPQSDEIVAQTSKFDPPKSPTVKITKSTSNSIQIQWERSEDVEGYLAYIREENGEWKEATLSPDVLTYNFENLKCGNAYQIYLVPFASGGKGERSQILSVKTNGRGPSAPQKDQFLQVNSTSVTVFLSAWDDGECPILHYFLRYKTQNEQQWTEIPVLSHRPRAFITGLNPGQWYKLVAGARNSAGNKEVEFDFLTRRMDIGKSQGIGHPPPVVAESSAMELQRRVAVITSAVCSAVVLVVILIAACAVLTRRRRQRPEGHDSGADRRSTGEIQKSETVALSAWEKRPRADSSHRSSQCRESLYLPCPYATARLSQFSVDGDADGVHHSVSLAGNEHSYDVPIQVVSKLH